MPLDRSIRRFAFLLSLLVLGAGAAAMPAGCDEQTDDSLERVRVGDETFFLELALDDPTRIKGLGGRDYVDPNGGMLFVFPRPAVLQFVMRDCPIPLDVAFLDPAGRVLAIHEMQPEPPQREGETDAEYESRLKQYGSRFQAQFAIETAGGRLAEVGLGQGDVVDLDLERLKRLAR